MLQAWQSHYEQAVILSGILGSLAILSLILLLWQWLAAIRFPLHQRASDHYFAPDVTVLKPLKGSDAEMEQCLRSWFTQDYAGAVQILLGVHQADDPACVVVKKILAEFPRHDAQFILTSADLGANGKVSNLAQLVKFAKYDVLVISDGDVRVPPDFLANAVAPLAPKVGQASRLPSERVSASSSDTPTPLAGAAGTCAPLSVGLVNCFYRLANPTTLAMQWEAIAINADFWSQVLQSKSLKPLDFALGAVMVTRRKYLDEIGGFESLVNCLADDYQLGHRIAANGHRIELSPIVVECWHDPQTFKAVWKHQLRWARTVRVCQPVPYFFSVLANTGFWALLWLGWESFGFTAYSPFFAALAFTCFWVRVLVACDLQDRMTRSLELKYCWLIPIKDLLQFAIWFCAFTGNTVEWRGQRFQLRKDGTLTKLDP